MGVVGRAADAGNAGGTVIVALASFVVAFVTEVAGGGSAAYRYLS